MSYPRDVPSQFLGMGERWRENSTASRVFFLFWIPVWWENFNHSTGLFD